MEATSNGFGAAIYHARYYFFLFTLIRYLNLVFENSLKLQYIKDTADRIGLVGLNSNYNGFHCIEIQWV